VEADVCVGSAVVSARRRLFRVFLSAALSGLGVHDRCTNQQDNQGAAQD
jgi:hypothetical protein